MKKAFITSLMFYAASLFAQEPISEIQATVDEILKIPSELRTFDNTLKPWIQLKNRLPTDENTQELLFEAEQHPELQFLRSKDFMSRYRAFLLKHRHPESSSTSSNHSPFYQPLQVKGDAEARVSKNEEGTAYSGGISVYDKDSSVSAEATVKVDPNREKTTNGEVKFSYNFFDVN